MKFKFLSVGLLLSVCGFANAGLITSVGLGGAVPDNDLTGITSSVYISDNEVIESLSVTLFGLNLTYFGDVIFTLSGPNGASTNLLYSDPSHPYQLGMHTDLIGDYTFSDTGTDLLNAVSLNISLLAPGSYSTADSSTGGASLTDTFFGISSAGEWSLTAIDHWGGDATSFDTWELNIQTVPEPSTLAIFALGMIGLALRRFKKQS
ncbi:MAG: PEP-CTERM sorting domain-containing protein [Colwellia sp.]